VYRCIYELCTLQYIYIYIYSCMCKEGQGRRDIGLVVVDVTNGTVVIIRFNLFLLFPQFGGIIYGRQRKEGKQGGTCGKEGRKEERKKERKEGRKEGRGEGRKGGRRERHEERRERRKEGRGGGGRDMKKGASRGRKEGDKDMKEDGWCRWVSFAAEIFLPSPPSFHPSFLPPVSYLPSFPSILPSHPPSPSSFHPSFLPS
jgi:hypothetical protein